MVGRLFCATLVLYLSAGWAVAGPEALKPDKDKVVRSFGSLTLLPVSDARAQAEAWLKGLGKADEETRKALDAIWSQDDRTVLDRVTDSLMLGSPEAKKLLTEVRDTKTSAPTEVPGILKDNKIHPFLRANLALAFAKACSERRIYEESRDCLMAVKAEQVVDPAQYLFLKGCRALPHHEEGSHREHPAVARRRGRLTRALRHRRGSHDHRHGAVEGQGPGLDRAQDG